MFGILLLLELKFFVGSLNVIIISKALIAGQLELYFLFGVAILRTYGTFLTFFHAIYQPCVSTERGTETSIFFVHLCSLEIFKTLSFLSVYGYYGTNVKRL